MRDWLVSASICLITDMSLKKADLFVFMRLLANSVKSKYAKLGKRSKGILGTLSVKTGCLIACFLGIIWFSTAANLLLTDEEAILQVCKAG